MWMEIALPVGIPRNIVSSSYIPGSFFVFTFDNPANFYEVKPDGSLEQKSLHPNITTLTSDPMILSDGQMVIYRSNLYTASAPFNSWTDLGWMSLGRIILSTSRFITLSTNLLRGASFNDLTTRSFELDPFVDDPNAFVPSSYFATTRAYNGEAVYALSRDFDFRRVAYSPNNGVPFSVPLNMPGSSVGAKMIFDATLEAPICAFGNLNSVAEFYTLNANGTLNNNAFVDVREVMGFSGFVMEGYEVAYCPTRGKTVALFRGREESANESPRWAIFLASGDGFNTYDILLRKGPFDGFSGPPGTMSSLSQDGVFAMRMNDMVVLTDLKGDAPKFWTSFIGTTEVTP